MTQTLDCHALFAASKHAPTPIEQLAAAEIWSHGRDNPVSLTTICFQFERNVRVVKGAIESLRRRHGLPIGVSRKPPAGYYWARSASDLIEASEPMRRQALSMLATVGRMRNVHRLSELLGQETL